jgi:hypothetical protein
MYIYWHIGQKREPHPHDYYLMLESECICKTFSFSQILVRILAARSAYPMYSAWRDIRALRSSRTRRILCCSHRDIFHINIIARMHVRATETAGPVSFLTRQVPGEVYKGNVGNFHQASAGKCAIVPTVFGNSDTGICTLHIEVGKEDITDGTPASATRKTC